MSSSVENPIDLPSKVSVQKAGTMARLTIQPYKDKDLKTEAGPLFHAAFFPEEFNESVDLEYNLLQEVNASSAEAKFVGIKPRTFTLKFLFDSTGVLPDHQNGGFVTTSVPDQIRDFKEMALDYHGDIHESYYLKIIYGSLLIQARLQSLQVSYTHFGPNGEPIRARATAGFIATEPVKDRLARENKQSPDVSHIITVMDGDSLPALTEKVYGSNKYLLQVAEYNHLNHFRKLKPGTKLYFPPLDSSTNA